MCIRDRDDPTRMLYTKQEWMKTKAEMNALFEDVPEALSNTLEILDKVEYCLLYTSFHHRHHSAKNRLPFPYLLLLKGLMLLTI